MEMQPTRPQPVYQGYGPQDPQQPLTAPRFVPNPVPPPAPVQQPPVPQPPVWQPPVPPPPSQAPRKLSPGTKLLIGGGVVFAVIAIASIGYAASYGSGQPPYVTQLQNDGYTLEDQGTLSGGTGVGWADGDDAAGYGELVIQEKSDADVQESVSGYQSDGSARVTTQGDLLIIQTASFSTIQNLVSSEGW